MKHRRYEAGFKLKVIAENTNNSAARRKFSVDEKLVCEWQKNATKIQEMPKKKCAQ